MAQLMMEQVAPYPVILGRLVDQLTFQDGRLWTFILKDVDRGQGSEGLTLVINISGPDAYHEGQRISVNHYMLVPPAAYDERSWLRWLFDQVGLVQLHERMEFFKIDGKQPMPPAHGPGNDPYLVLQYGTTTDRRTSFRGTLNPE
jgi:hypothetical protein